MKPVLMYMIVYGFFVSCTQDQAQVAKVPASEAISVLIDVTDPKLTWPEPNQVLQLFNCEQNPTAEFTFRLKAISDKRITPLITYHLADASTTDKRNDQHDPQNRNRNIAAFYNSVRTAMGVFYSNTDTSHSKQNSECYRAISDELTFLSKDTSERRSLLLFTDIMERSDVMDSYLEDLSDPSKIAAHLDSFQPRIPDLKGIIVIFVFNPRNRKEDKEFNNMVEAYKSLFQKKGATVMVQANL